MTLNGRNLSTKCSKQRGGVVNDFLNNVKKTTGLVNWGIPKGINSVGDDKNSDNTNDSVADSHLDYVGQGGLARA